MSLNTQIGSDASGIVSYVTKETTAGITPASATFYRIQQTGGGGFPLNVGHTDEKTIRTSGMGETGSLPTSIDVNGGFDTNCAIPDGGNITNYPVFFDWMSASIGATAAWTASAKTVAASFTITVTSGVAVITGADLSTIISSVVVGQKIKITNCTNRSNNGIFTVAAKVVGTPSITIAEKSIMVTETTPSTTVIQISRMIRNGQGLDTFSIYTAFPNTPTALNTYTIAKGVGIDGCTIAQPPQDTATITFGMMGSDYALSSLPITNASNTLGAFSHFDENGIKVCNAVTGAVLAEPPFLTVANGAHCSGSIWYTDTTIHITKANVAIKQCDVQLSSGKVNQANAIGSMSQTVIAPKTLVSQYSPVVFASSEEALQLYNKNLASKKVAIQVVYPFYTASGVVELVVSSPRVVIKETPRNAAAQDTIMEMSCVGVPIAYRDSADAYYAIQVDLFPVIP